MSAHAFLSASGSHRWLQCTPSAALERHLPDRGSVYAKEGSKAHACAEGVLTAFLKGEKAPELADVEMQQTVEAYVDLVIEKFNGARKNTPDALLLVEQRLDFSPWVPEGFGTGDAVILADRTLEVIDLKYGQGVPVSAKDNSQMKLYALGALHIYGLFYDIDQVTMTIVQPRLNDISSDTITIAELLHWGEEIKPIAQKAFNGQGEYRPGDHCRFCRAAAICKPRAEYNLELMKYEFEEADLLSDEDISFILSREKQLTNWLKTVTKYALEEAVLQDRKWPGYKLVEGRSNRVITKPDGLAKVLEQENYKPDQIYTAPALRKLTELEKLVGKAKFAELSAPYIEKPPGKLTLVPESDTRDEWTSTKAIINQFEED